MIPYSSFVNCVLQNNVPHIGKRPHLHNLLWQKGVCRYGSVKDMRCFGLPKRGASEWGRGIWEKQRSQTWRYHPVSLENGSKEGRNRVDHNSHKKLAPSTIKTTVSWCILLSLEKKKITVYQVASQTHTVTMDPPHLEENVQAKLHRYVTAERSQSLEEVKTSMDEINQGKNTMSTFILDWVAYSSILKNLLRPFHQTLRVNVGCATSTQTAGATTQLQTLFSLEER